MARCWKKGSRICAAARTSRCRARMSRTNSGTTAPTAGGARRRPTNFSHGRKARSMRARSTSRLSGNKVDQGVERCIRGFGHQRVPWRLERNYLAARDLLLQRLRGPRRRHQIAPADDEQRRAFHLRRAFESRSVVVAGLQAGVKDAGSQALEPREGIAVHPHAWIRIAGERHLRRMAPNGMHIKRAVVIVTRGVEERL